MEENDGGYSHVSLPYDLIEILKNVNNWDEWTYPWTFDEEHMWLSGMALSNEESCYDINTHISLPEDLINKLKNAKTWEEWPSQWTFDEERMSLAWLWPHSMNDDKIHNANNGAELVSPNNEQK